MEGVFITGMRKPNKCRGCPLRDRATGDCTVQNGSDRYETYGEQYKHCTVFAVANVVEVVRCKDCKYSEPYYRDKLICSFWHSTGIDVWDDGFCNYGTRKGEDNG